jgi:hypothetical protein
MARKLADFGENFIVTPPVSPAQKVWGEALGV